MSSFQKNLTFQISNKMVKFTEKVTNLKCLLNFCELDILT